MKLTKTEKAIRRSLKAMLIAQGGSIYTDADVGATIITKPAAMPQGGRFIKVSIAQCSDSDTFSRKRGEYIALQRMFDGMTISLPGTDGMQDFIAEQMLETINACQTEYHDAHLGF